MDRCVAHGFSLIELMVVVSLLALTASMAIPSYGKLIDRNRALALTDQLQSQLAHARALSVSLNRDVEICGSSDGELCDGGWDRGWLLRVVNETEPYSRHALSTHEHLYLQGGVKPIRFHSNGTSPLGNRTFSICDAHAKTVVWKLVINRQGRVRRARGEGASCE